MKKTKSLSFIVIALMFLSLLLVLSFQPTAKAQTSFPYPSLGQIGNTMGGSHVYQTGNNAITRTLYVNGHYWVIGSPSTTSIIPNFNHLNAIASSSDGINWLSTDWNYKDNGYYAQTWDNPDSCDVASKGNEIYYVICDGLHDPIFVHITANSDGSWTWDNTVLLDAKGRDYSANYYNGDISGTTSWPTLAIDSNGYIWAAWCDFNANSLVWSKSLDKNGDSWTNPVPIASMNHAKLLPLTNGNMMLIASFSNGFGYSVFDSHSNVWSSPILISNSDCSFDAFVNSQGLVSLVSYSSSSIFVSQSQNGAPFSSPTLIGLWSLGSGNPSLGITGSSSGDYLAVFALINNQTILIQYTNGVWQPQTTPFQLNTDSENYTPTSSYFSMSPLTPSGNIGVAFSNSSLGNREMYFQVVHTSGSNPISFPSIPSIDIPIPGTDKTVNSTLVLEVGLVAVAFAFVFFAVIVHSKKQRRRHYRF